MSIKRRCNHCGIILNNKNWYNSFHKSSNYICKKCANKKSKKYNKENRERRNFLAKKNRDKNIEKVREQRRSWANKNKDRIKYYSIKYKDKKRNYILMRNYNITLEDYNRMYVFQGGKCAICRNREDRYRKTRLSVDHCHDNGIVRGLLCIRCNTWLGRYEDKKFLKRVIDYINKR